MDPTCNDNDDDDVKRLTCSDYAFSLAAREPVFVSLFSTSAGHSTAEWQSGDVYSSKFVYLKFTFLQCKWIMSFFTLTAEAISLMSSPMYSFPVPLNGILVLTMLTKTPILSCVWLIL